MRDRLGQILDALFEHYVFVLLILAQAALAQFGVANALSCGMVGLLLCAAGLGLRRSACIDPWVAVPMAAYLFLGMASSYMTYGNTVRGYPATHVIFFAIYFLMACMDGGELRLFKRLNALWAGCAAAISLGMFLLRALAGTAGRLGGLLHNPNALGIFLVVGWFAVTACLEEGGEDLLDRLLRYAEPLILTTLALTLSMGSFAAMAAGILVLLLEKKRRASWREVFDCGCRVLAKASLCFAAGILMYLTARQTRIPWLCLLLAVWLLALAASWGTFERFLSTYRWAAVGLSGGGLAVAAAAVVIRPSAVATFAERIEMMKNGLGYILFHPVLGLGPGQWREWNLYDGDKYFGTWHIHNFLIHTGVELGLIAMAMLVIILLRHFRKTGAPGAAAFVVHNLMDTSFFYSGITTLMLVSVGEPQKGGKPLGRTATRAVLVLLMAHFAWCCVYMIWTYFL